ncbi:hypothetical protein [Streptomyces sp. NPDC007346]|uniref:hypothetical protein n=1 Tax=Streptomyces sp. NPDC007346 TaxID=3154682 RepID=UPI003451495F
MSQRPTIGRVVHYVSHGTPLREDGTQRFPSIRRPAEITEVDEEGHVGLMIKNPDGLLFRPIGHSDGPIPYVEPVPGEPLQGGTWHWPERV